MKVKIFNYRNEGKTIDIGNLDLIATIEIKILSGDEVMHVIYKDYNDREFDSDTHERLYDFYDGSYEIYGYRKRRENNLIFDENWKSKTSSYARQNYANEKYHLI